MFSAQQLESDIVLILTFHHESCPNSPEETLSLIKHQKEKSEQLTLGQLIKVLKTRISINSQQEDILSDALKIRNDLAHNFLGQNHHKISDPNLHASLISGIKANCATLDSARNELRPYCTSIFAALSNALKEMPQTAVKTKLQSHLSYMLAPAEPLSTAVD
jgi:hypothetical protein